MIFEEFDFKAYRSEKKGVERIANVFLSVLYVALIIVILTR